MHELFSPRHTRPAGFRLLSALHFGQDQEVQANVCVFQEGKVAFLMPVIP